MNGWHANLLTWRCYWGFRIRLWCQKWLLIGSEHSKDLPCAPRGSLVFRLFLVSKCNHSEKSQPVCRTRKHAFLRILWCGKCIFKVNLSAFDTVSYSQSKYDKPLKYYIISTLEMEQRTFRDPQSHTFRSHLCLQVIHIFKTGIRIFTAPLHFLTYSWQTKRKGWVVRFCYITSKCWPP